MGKLVRTSTPLLFQSKLLCSSLSYLFLSLFFAFYTSLSPTTKCHFRSCPFDPLQSPLFIYPQSYGQQKHPIPTIKSSCNSPVFFSGNIMFSFNGVILDCFYIDLSSEFQITRLFWMKSDELLRILPRIPMA